MRWRYPCPSDEQGCRCPGAPSCGDPMSPADGPDTPVVEPGADTAADALGSTGRTVPDLTSGQPVDVEIDDDDLPEPLALYPPVVAVVVTRNPGPWLDDTLAALAAQDYPDLTVLVVDCGSDDDPTARVAELLPRAVRAPARRGRRLRRRRQRGAADRRGRDLPPPLPRRRRARHRHGAGARRGGVPVERRASSAPSS